MKKKIVIILAIFILCIYIVKVFPARTDLNYCKEIAFWVNFIGMENARCNVIFEENEIIYFSGEIRNVSKGENEGYESLLKIRKYVTDYLNKHPENMLNTKKIVIDFQTYPGESVSVSNYDNITDDTMRNSTDFSYYNGLFVKNASILSELDNPRVIKSVSIENIDDLLFVEQWNELYYIHFWGQELSDEQKKYLCSHLTNCDIYVSNQKIQGKQDEK